MLYRNRKEKLTLHPAGTAIAVHPGLPPRSLCRGPLGTGRKWGGAGTVGTVWETRVS